MKHSRSLNIIIKRRSFVTVCLLICGMLTSAGQILTDSNLPVVVITTDTGEEIPDDPRVLATMKIIYRGSGERNYLTDANNPLYLNYNGRISIEQRGSSTQVSPKKQYGFTTLQADNITNNNVSLLGLPAENDWILNGMSYDTARIRDYLAYNLSRQLGNYASRTVYCEVVINNDYKGLYLLQEKIKAGKNRVDVVKITSTDNEMPYVSGGYITKADKADGDPVAWTMYSHTGSPVDYIHVLPKPENATTQQTGYIKSVFTGLETTAREGNSSVAGGYPSIIDIPSFIDFMLIIELTANVDAYTYSTYFHKDRNGKLRAGPVWDFDLTLGNDLLFWGYDRSKPTGWYFNDYQLDGSTFWIDLFNDPIFRCYLSKRWNDYTIDGQPLSLTSLSDYIDLTTAYTSEAVARDYLRWSITDDHQQLISDIKTFLTTRTAWITDNIGSYSGCSQTVTPPLVISEIMYNPALSAGFTNPDDIEFIRITNNGADAVALAGYYFGGTGFVFCFSDNAVIGGKSSVYLASNAVVFQARYGFAPFGQYSRNLSDSGETLMLLDAFGNVTDIVSYTDSAPWPDADGNGYYLKLISADYDNNIASSWTATNDIISSLPEPQLYESVSLFPNPVRNYLTINSDEEIKRVRLFDLRGCILDEVIVNTNSYDLSMSQYSKGIYVVRIELLTRTVTQTVVKE